MLIEQPRPDYRTVINARDAMNSDIIAAIHKALPKAVEQMRQFAPKFQSYSVDATARNIWTYLKTAIRYKKDSDEWQLVKLPSRLLADKTGDCKSYSLFTAATLAALGLPVCFRYAIYSGSVPSHVYVTTSDEHGNEIIIDGVWSRYNDEKPYKDKKDFCMNVATLSGIGADGEEIRLVDSDLWKNKDKSPAHQALYQRWKAAWIKKNSRRSNLPPHALIPPVFIPENILIREGIAPAGPGFFTRIWDGIVNIATEAYKVIKKGILSAPRTAFLGLLAINVHGMATKFDKANQVKPNDVKKKWESLGGSYSALVKAINSGKNKKSILGYDDNTQVVSGTQTIGALPALLAAAAPIIAVMAKLLNGIKDATGLDVQIPDVVQAAIDAGGNVNEPTDLPGGPEEGSENEADDATGFTLSTPVMIGIAAIAALLIFNN